MPKKICTTIRITGLAGLLALTLTACTPITEPPHSITYQSIMISAEWRGTSGTPVISSQEVPPKWNGSKCPTASLKLENHVTAYPAFPGGNELIVTNSCEIPIVEIAICRGGDGGMADAIPVCATDPRQTPRAGFAIRRLENGSRGSWGTTASDVSVRVFYCPSGNHLNFGIVSGKAPTDCVVDASVGK